MSKSKSESGSSKPAEPRTNPEVDAKIDGYIQRNPRFLTYLQSMPRERLERMVVWNEVRRAEQRERMDGRLRQEIAKNPQLKEAFDLILSKVPPERRDDAMAEMMKATRLGERSQRQPNSEQGIRSSV